MNSDDLMDGWNRRLRAVRGLVVTLARETQGLRVDDHARPIGGHLELVAGTRVRYVETGYDAMRLDQAFHTVKVMSGSATGTWVDLFDSMSLGPLPWEV
jgi:hypothetical protein